jgi:hypothetical protein
MSIRIVWLGLVLFATVAPATSLAGQSVQPSTQLCWQSLQDAPQDEPPAIAESMLAAGGPDDIWLARRWSAPPLLRWVSGKWSAPEPVRVGVDVWPEAVAASPSGDIVIAAAANLDNTARVLHIGRLINGAWHWLGDPLISSPDPSVHAQRASMAFVAGQPVVTWSEGLPTLGARLFVSRWNGSAWTRLGSISPSAQDSFLTPAIAVDSKQQIWLAWSDETEARVVRWNGSMWIDIGRDSLKTISAAQGQTSTREISLAVGTNGDVWVLSLASQSASGPALFLARWDGMSWRGVTAPRGPAGKDSTAWSASMILRNDAPIVAWSQADETDNHHLYVAELTAGDRWSALLSGLHLVEGISRVTDVRLAAGDARSLYVSWDEPGKDNRSTRVVRAYSCPVGETPAAPPKAIVERETWPTTVAEAAKRLVEQLDDESKARVRATEKDRLIQYLHGWGTGIRNSLGLWRGNEKLLASCGGGTRADPEACSMVIIEAVWTVLQAPK